MHAPRLARLLLAAIGFALSVVLGLAAASAAGAATGPDVSNYQHPKGAPIDWNQVKAAGHKFAFVKATEGPSGAGGWYTNPWFAADWRDAGNVGLLRGAYHFAQPQYPLESAIQQARYFVSVTGTMRGNGDLPPVLDLEATGGLPPNDLITWTGLYLSEVERLTGRKPIIYSGYYFWREKMNDTTLFKDYRFWIARYTSAPDPLPLPPAWSTWTLWQYTSSASVPGIVGNVDMNRFCCPDANLFALADGSSANPAAGNPFGNNDWVQRIPGGVTVGGWAIDPDTTAPIDVHVYVDGAPAAAVRADRDRADLPGAFPGWGRAHGFEVTVPTGPGDHTVCAYGINTGSGNANALLGCRVTMGTPLGDIVRAEAPAPGQLRVSGWAIDPDTDGPIAVHVYVDGKGAAVVNADRPYPALTDRYPAAGPSHGYEATVGALATGWHSVCTYGINVGSGVNAFLGCRWVSVLPAAPIGALDVVSGGAGQVYVRGWAIDPDTTGPIDVHVYVDGAGIGALRADRDRPDLAAVFPVYGPAHGYEGNVGNLAPGAHLVCVYGINVGPGGNNALGCASFTVPTGPPFGALDEVRVDRGALWVRGWAIDPDSTAPVAVRISVDGKLVVSGPAGLARPDVGAAFPAFGPGHGYELAASGIGGGTHQVCGTAVDPVTAALSSVGCRTVVAPGEPFGSFDVAERTAEDTAHLYGWTIDPDTPDPIAVHVYVDGVGVAILTADGDRPDVGAAFPAYGPAHGWSVDLTGLSPGPHQACAYAINTLTGTTNVSLGCAAI